MSRVPDLRRRVIVVVRNDDARLAIAQVLQRRGFELLAYDDAAAAMIRLRRDELLPDFVILDWNLAGWSSAEFLRKLVSTPRFVRSRVIVLADRVGDIPSLCVSAVLPRDTGPERLAATIDELAT